MNEYNFKVVAELRNDLTDEQRKNAVSKIEELQRKFKIVKIDDATYCKAGAINGHDDFGAVTFFFCKLKRIKEYFGKLEYYDLPEGDISVAV